MAEQSPAPEERRHDASRDRRTHSRGGRRESDAGSPWYMRRRWWLAVASIMYVGWRRVVRRGTRA